MLYRTTSCNVRGHMVLDERLARQSPRMYRGQDDMVLELSPYMGRRPPPQQQQHGCAQEANMLNALMNGEENIDVSMLLEDEKRAIWRVLQRDEELRKKDEIRIRRLKMELQALRYRGVLKVGSGQITINADRSCARCREQLGRILNRGAVCKSCRQRVCKSCREYNISATEWVCSVCHKQMELQLATGDWVNVLSRRPSNWKDRHYVPPTEILKKSLKRAHTISNPEVRPHVEIRAPGYAKVQVKPQRNTQDENCPPASHQPRPPQPIPRTKGISRRSSMSAFDGVRYLKGPAPPPPPANRRPTFQYDEREQGAHRTRTTTTYRSSSEIRQETVRRQQMSRSYSPKVATLPSSFHQLPTSGNEPDADKDKRVGITFAEEGQGTPVPPPRKKSPSRRHSSERLAPSQASATPDSGVVDDGSEIEVGGVVFSKVKRHSKTTIATEEKRSTSSPHRHIPPAAASSPKKRREPAGFQRFRDPPPKKKSAPNLNRSHSYISTSSEEQFNKDDSSSSVTRSSVPDTNSDIAFDAHKMLPEGDDYKLVFISSDSSRDSDMNSSLEDSFLNHSSDHSGTRSKITSSGPDESDVTGFMDESDWEIPLLMKGDGSAKKVHKNSQCEIDSLKPCLPTDLNVTQLSDAEVSISDIPPPQLAPPKLEPVNMKFSSSDPKKDMLEYFSPSRSIEVASSDHALCRSGHLRPIQTADGENLTALNVEMVRALQVARGLFGRQGSDGSIETQEVSMALSRQASTSTLESQEVTMNLEDGSRTPSSRGGMSRINSMEFSLADDACGPQVHSLNNSNVKAQWNIEEIQCREAAKSYPRMESNRSSTERSIEDLSISEQKITEKEHFRIRPVNVKSIQIRSFTDYTDHLEDQCEACKSEQHSPTFATTIIGDSTNLPSSRRGYFTDSETGECVEYVTDGEEDPASPYRNSLVRIKIGGPLREEGPPIEAIEKDLKEVVKTNNAMLRHDAEETSSVSSGDLQPDCVRPEPSGASDDDNDSSSSESQTETVNLPAEDPSTSTVVLASQESDHELADSSGSKHDSETEGDFLDKEDSGDEAEEAAPSKLVPHSSSGSSLDDSTSSEREGSYNVNEGHAIGSSKSHISSESDSESSEPGFSSKFIPPSFWTKQSTSSESEKETDITTAGSDQESSEERTYQDETTQISFAEVVLSEEDDRLGNYEQEGSINYEANKGEQIERSEEENKGEEIERSGGEENKDNTSNTDKEEDDPETKAAQHLTCLQQESEQTIDLPSNSDPELKQAIEAGIQDSKSYEAEMRESESVAPQVKGDSESDSESKVVETAEKSQCSESRDQVHAGNMKTVGIPDYGDAPILDTDYTHELLHTPNTPLQTYDSPDSQDVTNDEKESRANNETSADALIDVELTNNKERRSWSSSINEKSFGEADNKNEEKRLVSPQVSVEEDKINSGVTIVNVGFASKKNASEGVTVIRIDPYKKSQVIRGDSALEGEGSRNYTVTTLCVNQDTDEEGVKKTEEKKEEKEGPDKVYGEVTIGSSSVILKGVFEETERNKTKVTELQQLIAQTRERTAEMEREQSIEGSHESGLLGYFTKGLETTTTNRKRPVVTKVLSPEPKKDNVIVLYQDPVVIDELGTGSELKSFSDDESSYGILSEADEEVTQIDTVMGHSEGGESEDDRFDSMDDFDSSYAYSDISSGEETYFDREEELRGFNRVIDLTLHTIIEESCEESDGDKTRSLSPNVNPSELEKYFYFDLGDYTNEPNRKSTMEDTEFSDTISEDSSSIFSENMDSFNKQEEKDPADLASSRLEKYFMTGLTALDRKQSLIEDSEHNTDESSSVGSESEGQPSPEQKKKKVIRRRRGSQENILHVGNRTESISSDMSSTSNLDEEQRRSSLERDCSLTTVKGSSTDDEEMAFEKSDGQFDTVKRRKKKKGSSMEHLDLRITDSDKKDESHISAELLVEKRLERSKSLDTVIGSKEGKEERGSGSKSMTVEQSQSLESIKPLEHKKYVTTEEKDGQKSSLNSLPELISKDKSSIENASTSFNLEKRQRDSGFIGSSDDLLKDSINDENKQISESDKDVKQIQDQKETKDDKLDSPTIEQKEDERSCASTPLSSARVSRSSSFLDTSSPSLKPRVKLSRKDSFNNWSSDEETNQMMSKMRAFFKSMVAVKGDGKKCKPPQLVDFENKLTSLMRTVPGINDEQVREIVEYLSSEDTWSDSYDSSDYTSTDLDMEGDYLHIDMTDDGQRSELQEQISASCQEIIQKFDQTRKGSDSDDISHSSDILQEDNESQLAKETAIVYQKLVNSFSKMTSSASSTASSPHEGHKEIPESSPPLIAKVWHHIGNRLVALMHEVTVRDDLLDTTSNESDSKKDFQVCHSEFLKETIASSPKVRQFLVRKAKLEAQRSISSCSNPEKSSLASTSFDSEDSPTDSEQFPESDVTAAVKTNRAHLPPLFTLPLRVPEVQNDPLVDDEPATPTSPSHFFTERRMSFGETEKLEKPKSHQARNFSSLPRLKKPSSNKEEKHQYERPLFSSGKSITLTNPSLNMSELHSSLERVLSEGESSSKSQHSDSVGDLLDRARLSEFSSCEQLEMTENKFQTSRSEFSSCEQLDSDTTIKQELDSDVQLGDYQPSWLTEGNKKPRDRSGLSFKFSRFGKSDSQVNRQENLETAAGSGSSEVEFSYCKDLGGSDRKFQTLPSSHDQSKRRSSVPDLTKERNSSTLPYSLFSRKNKASASEEVQQSSSPIGDDEFDKPAVEGEVRSVRYRPPGYRTTTTIAPKRTGSMPQSAAKNKELFAWFEEEAVRASAESSDSGSLTRDRADSLTSSSQNTVHDDDIDRIVALHRLRKSNTGSLQSSIADSTESVGEIKVVGAVEFGVQHNSQHRSLEIHVKRCRDLAAVDNKRLRSDPYVKAYLLPDRSKGSKRKTKVKRHTLNPVFDEVLRFPVGASEASSRTLSLSVWHSDMFGRNDFLGEVKVPLSNVNMADPSPKWYTLQEKGGGLKSSPIESKEESPDYRGEIKLAIKYQPADVRAPQKLRRTQGSFHVLVQEAKHLPSPKPTQPPDPVCKCQLLPDKTKQKSAVLKRTSSPEWKHTFVFEEVTPEELKQRTLEVSVWDQDRFATSTFLGAVRFCLPQNGKPIESSGCLEEEVRLWQSMFERPGMWVQACLTLRASNT